ncbi:ABC transporter ATP-binding protein [Halobacillus sp. A5]|uniref:ATP-binding cassette domain-containing protein n=1 Tax=Halobacillus sp. A5 TaxID=2880263 RepID=UPI0020A636CF|nr:ABC transporter ATP-binding protein [Halobacillus sp. A5]MCP3027039.1 ABC transporter ATP-binding protein [Halobacillus sp. A5]
MANKNTLLKVRGLTFAYEDSKNDILNDISFNIYSKEITCIVGRNGAGKSTLLKTLAKVIAYNGKISFEDSKLMTVKDYKQKVAYLPDKPLLYDSLTAYQNLKLIRNLWMLEDGNEYVNRCNELSKVLYMEEHLDKPIEQFSLGMKEKLFFIANLARNPSVILMDEPFSSWDKESFEQAHALLKDYINKEKAALLFVSHSESLKQRLSNRILNLKDGKIYEGGIVSYEGNSNFPLINKNKD